MNPEAEKRVAAAWRFLLATLITFLVFNLIAASIAEAVAPSSLHRFEAVYRPLTVILLLAGFSAMAVFADEVEGNPLPSMGLGMRRPWRRECALGVLLGSGLVAFAVAVIAVFGNLSLTVHLAMPRALALLLLELFVLATGAMAEEIAFRGYPFQRLVEAVGPGAAIVLTSALFGAIHLRNPHASAWGFLNTIAVGVLLSLAYLRTRALWLPWGIHFGWNTTLGLIFGLPVSGLTEFAVIVRGKAEGPAWLTGGAYGIEASAVGTAVIVLGVMALLTWVRPFQPAAPGTAQTREQEKPGPPAPISGIQA